jgi:tripartite-type tricarboxylate transporter receptor subunit TctC
MTSRVIAAFLAFAASLAFVGSVSAQMAGGEKPAFRPTRPVTIVVPYSPGGGTDAVGRLLAKALEEMWGQTVIVDNRTGANGSIGAALVARSAPDGHMLVFSVSAIAINAHVMKLPYDTATAFAPITPVAYTVATLIGSPTLPVDDYKGFVELVRKEGPDKRTFASPDPGSRLTAEKIFDKAGIKLMNIPYKGAAQFVGDIAAGRVDVGISSITSALSLIQAGKLKALGIIGDRRMNALPQAATFKEQGFSGLEENSWYGLFAPAGTPAPVIEALHTDIAKVIASPEFRKKMEEYGAIPGGQPPAEFSKRFQRDLAESSVQVRQLGMQVE